MDSAVVDALAKEVGAQVWIAVWLALSFISDACEKSSVILQELGKSSLASSLLLRTVVVCHRWGLTNMINAAISIDMISFLSLVLLTQFVDQNIIRLQQLLRSIPIQIAHIIGSVLLRLGQHLLELKCLKQILFDINNILFFQTHLVEFSIPNLNETVRPA